METIVTNNGDSIGYVGLTQNTGRIIVIDQASRFRAMRQQYLELLEEREMEEQLFQDAHTDSLRDYLDVGKEESVDCDGAEVAVCHVSNESSL